MIGTLFLKNKKLINYSYDFPKTFAIMWYTIFKYYICMMFHKIK